MQHVVGDPSAQAGVQQSIASAITTGGAEEIYEGLFLKSALVPIEQSLIDSYAEMCGDKNPIHLDPQHARRCKLKNTIAQGALVFSRALGLAYELGCFQKTGTQFTEANLKFKAPVYAGDRISLQLKIVKAKELRHGIVRVVAEAKIVNQEDVIIQENEWHGFFNKQSGHIA